MIYTVTVSDAAMMVAITEDKSILLKSEYRYSCGEELIECLAGPFDKGETDPLAVAKRELFEETGYVSENRIYLGATRENTSKLTNTMHLFFTQRCKKIAKQHLDSTEQLKALEVLFSRAEEERLFAIVLACSSKGCTNCRRLLMGYKSEYNRWIENVKEDDLLDELKAMDDVAIENHMN